MWIGLLRSAMLLSPSLTASLRPFQLEILALSRLLQRQAILLVPGDKAGGGGKRFYRELIRKADNRFDAHLSRLKTERK
jgi:hypothetical protein